MPILDDAQVREALSALDGWDRDGDEIVRDLKFGTFRDAVTFVVRVSYEAEAANHHPDIDIRYNHVHVALSTHSEGGITASDIELAHAIDRLAASFGG